MKIINCKVNHLIDPIGYEFDYPLFTFSVAESHAEQLKYGRILVALDAQMKHIIADTGWNDDIKEVGYELIMPLSPRSRYYWTVSVQTDLGEKATSQINFFETAKMTEKWEGSWISCDSAIERHPLFSKEIELEGSVKTARLYICGLGLYEAYMNGIKISDELLAPYCNDYNTWVQYQTYDVTNNLNCNNGDINNKNTLSVLLGNGWYKGRFGYDSSMNQKAYYGDSWKLIAELHIIYEDGHEQIIGTDTTWKVTRTNITCSNIYDGEKRDDTLEASAEENALSDSWNNNDGPKLTPRYSIPIKTFEHIKPIATYHTVKDEIVLDMGQNFAGIFQLKVKEDKGKRIYLQFGEVMQDGCFYRDNLRSAKAEYEYISDGAEHVLQPHFTYYGYRYVKIEGIRDLKEDDFYGIVMHSDIKQVGRIITGNEKINKLIENTKWSQFSNFMDIPTDCPQRDERMGWTGDAQVFASTALFTSDAYAFYRKYLKDIHMEQGTCNGMVPNVVPSFGKYECSSVWGDAICIIPWTLYEFYGDKSILKECFTGMEEWLSYIDRLNNEGHAWSSHFHFGDWLALDHPLRSVNEATGGTEEAFIADIYYMNSLRIAQKTAAVLKLQEKEDLYHKKADKVLQDIRQEYITGNGRCAITTQTGYVLALYYGIATNRKKTAAELERSFKVRKNELQTGFVGTPLLLKTLSEAGLDKLAYSILLNEDYPSWLYEVNLGATTIWERWNSMNADGTVSSTGMNSFNHYAYGSVVEWIWRYCAGINMYQPGFQEIRLTPRPCYELRSVQAEYLSPMGLIKSGWKVIDKTHIKYEVEIPFGCVAKLELPDLQETEELDRSNPIFENYQNGICTLKHGYYSISYKMGHSLSDLYNIEMPVKILLENKVIEKMLLAKMPGIAMMPSSMKEVSFRTLMERFNKGQEGLDEKLEKMNQMLQNL